MIDYVVSQIRNFFNGNNGNTVAFWPEADVATRRD
jgi:hypothetical protein